VVRLTARPASESTGFAGFAAKSDVSDVCQKHEAKGSACPGRMRRDPQPVDGNIAKPPLNGCTWRGIHSWQSMTPQKLCHPFNPYQVISPFLQSILPLVKIGMNVVYPFNARELMVETHFGYVAWNAKGAHVTLCG